MYSQEERNCTLLWDLLFLGSDRYRIIMMVLAHRGKATDDDDDVVVVCRLR